MARAYYSEQVNLPGGPQAHSPPSGNPYPDPIQTLPGNHGPGQMRQCSVRGCTTMLPPEYAQKMCEACRGRHRIYASTKRAKRKMEKLAIGGQLGSVVWMPPNSDEREEPHAGPSTQPDPALEDHEPPVPQYPLSTSTWDNSAIDPSLFSPDGTVYSQTQQAAPQDAPYPHDPNAYAHYPGTDVYTHDQSAFPHDPSGHPFSESPESVNYAYPPNSSSYQDSELAGALQMPQHRLQSQQTTQSFIHHQDQSTPPSQAYSSDHSNSRTPAPQPRTPAVPTGEISAKAISEVAAEIGGSTLPHRYCSVKGCKAVVPGDSFFKMCEPCRNRYRSYGTTKRAKWKREKEAAVAELQRLRQEEDQRRAAMGLSPLNEGDWMKAPPDQLLQVANSELPPDFSPPQTQTQDYTSIPGITPRMCTVSHCREVLPPEYTFLRCERHRIQNRHHSKLKRVRDKESKAAAFQGWTQAAVNANGTAGASGNAVAAGSGSSQSPFGEEDNQDEARPYFDPIIRESEVPGIPPAARGSRRTNHVCSIKSCCNLLSPFNPWKMCDSCRDRDRTARKIKALRDSGFNVDPLPPKPRTPPPPDGSTQKKAKKKKKQEPQPQPIASQQNSHNQATEPVEQNPGNQQVEMPQGATASTSQGSQLVTTGASSPVVFVHPLGPPPDKEGPQISLMNHIENAEAISANLPQDGSAAAPTTNATGTMTGAAAPSVAMQHASEHSSSSMQEPAMNTIAGSTTASTANTTTNGSSQPDTVHMTPTFSSPTSTSSQQQQVPTHYLPYYMPYMHPYPPGSQYRPYGSTPTSSQLPRDAFAPSPMYQPPYLGYPPYPYAWSPWGPSPVFPAMTTPASSAPAATTSQNTDGSSASPSASGSTTAPPRESISDQQPPPPPPPPDKAAMYSTFSSRPPGTSYRTHTSLVPQDSTPAPAPAPPDPLKVTFTIHSGVPVPSHMKRKRQVKPPADAPPSKRLEGQTSNPGPALSDAVQQQQPQHDVQGVSGAEFAAAVSAIATGGLGVSPSQVGDASNHAANSNSTSTGAKKRPTCSNKSCHRPLPAGITASHALCDRCKEKIRKKTEVAKRRFKLEPRNLVVSAAPGRVDGSTA